MKITTTLSAFLLLVIINHVRAQAPLFSGTTKSYKQAVALHKAKSYLRDSVIGAGTAPVLFEIDEHAARKSTGLTAIAYRCSTLNKAGLLFGFFGERKEPNGAIGKVYAFKHIPAHSAIILFEKLENLVNENSKYLSGGRSNNIMFQYEGITFIINYYIRTRIEVIWEGFESTWDLNDFKRAKGRLH